MGYVNVSEPLEQRFTHESAKEYIKSNMSKTFDMTDLGFLHYYLCVEVWKTCSSVFVSQTKYARSLLDKFKMTNWKISSTPMEKGSKLSTNTNSKAVNESIYRKLVGILIYLTATTPNLGFVVRFISKFMTTPNVEHWIVVKPVLRYVKGTLDFGILYSRSKDHQWCGSTNSIWVGYVDDRKSTFGYVFSLGTGGVTWTSKKKHAVALSSTEAKY
jgi:hypothetical protein